MEKIGKIAWIHYGDVLVDYMPTIKRTLPIKAHSYVRSWHKRAKTSNGRYFNGKILRPLNLKLVNKIARIQVCEDFYFEARAFSRVFEEESEVEKTRCLIYKDFSYAPGLGAVALVIGSDGQAICMVRNPDLSEGGLWYPSVGETFDYKDAQKAVNNVIDPVTIFQRGLVEEMGIEISLEQARRTVEIHGLVFNTQTSSIDVIGIIDFRRDSELTILNSKYLVERITQGYAKDGWEGNNHKTFEVGAYLPNFYEGIQVSDILHACWTRILSNKHL